MITARVLVDAVASGAALRLDRGISFWGAVDPLTGCIADQRHPQAGEFLKGRIVLIPRSLGSSSGSAILLELMRLGCGPAGIVLGEPDQILTLGAVIGREMGYAAIPVLLIDSARFDDIKGVVSIAQGGKISVNDAH